jgi:hypothetical protein
MPNPLLGDTVGDAQPAIMTSDAQTDSADRVERYISILSIKLATALGGLPFFGSKKALPLG